MQLQVPWTYTSASRTEAKAAAQLLYHRFQRVANPGSKRFYSFDTAGVSIFVADTRSERTPFKAEAPGFFSPPQREQLETWFASLSTPGVLVLPQPLFQHDGDWKDRSLSNFSDDYAFLCELFERALQADHPHDVLIITGDIHTGRHAEGRIAGLRDSVHEFVASPSARIWQPGRVKPNAAPGKLFPKQRPSWTIWVSHDDQTPSTDNHVGLVDVTEGRNGRKRFILELWRVRKNDDRLYWERETAVNQRQPTIQRMLRKEVELR